VAKASKKSGPQGDVRVVGILPSDGPMRIQLRRVKGWRMAPNCVKVDRSTRWGNPFRVAHGYPASAAVTDFARWLRGDASFKCHGLPPTTQEIRAALRGHNLACWCAIDSPCHADVLLAVANSED
jgi:hypothetical protein